MSTHDPLESLADEPAKPVALYRGPALTLFRGWTLVGLVVVCVGVGALGRGAADDAIAFLSALSAAPPPPAPPAPAPQQAPRGPPELLSAAGPRVSGKVPAQTGGATTFPTGVPSLVNVWLQGCHDCLPAFAAWRELRAAGLLPAHLNIYNVAYGTADSAWAKSYVVEEKLHYDDGSVFVRPLGISSFTTLLLDKDGVVRLRDRPDAPGYADRITGAMRVLWSDPHALPEAEPSVPPATQQLSTSTMAPDPPRR
ncbi:MAG: hypothetical protein IT383_21830 [Deltaproteobacteria bacterium]|nr:hypothetical protein [Deltaproteobacteria bacterium]